MSDATQTLDDITPDQVAAIMAGPPEDAAAWLRKLAEQGVAEAQVMYGQCLLDGMGVAADPFAALLWFLKAAQTGHAMAENMAGRCYENGWGTQADLTMAAHWYGRSAAQEFDWGLYNLATLLTLGRGIAHNRPRAFALYQKAAEQGHAKSLNIVGGFYEDGWEVEKNLATARGYYVRAAKGGDFRGQFNLGRFLAQEGLAQEALAQFRAARQTAPQAFTDKMLAFLKERNLRLDEDAAQ